MAPTRRTSARQQLKTPNTVNVTHAEQATADEHIITPVTDDHIASTSALHSSACRGDDQPGTSAKAAKTPRRGNLSRRSKKASPAKGKREQDSIECTSLGEKQLASTSTSALHISECRGDDRPGSFAKRAKIKWRGNFSRRSKRASATKRKREEETEVEAALRLSSQSQRRQYVLSHETLGERNYRLYCKSVYTYSLKSKRKLPKRLQDNKKAASSQALLRSRQSPHRKATRNAADAAATSIRRSQETTAKKTARNAAKAVATSILRSQESMAEKIARHAAYAAATSAARATESSAQKRTRRQRDAISTYAARAVEEPTERLKTVNQRRHAQQWLCSPPKQFWFKLVFNYETVLRLSGRKDRPKNGLENLQLPAPLKALLEGSSPDSKYFLAKIRKHNCAIQMTSFGGNAFREVGWNPTFKVQGQVYHQIVSLLPETVTDSAFLQIYFIADYNQQADARIGIIPENDTGQDNHPRRDIIMCLQQMPHEINSYVRSFKHALENTTSSDFIIVIDADKRPQGEHERRYNAPASNEVSVIVSGDQHNRRDIVIESRGSGLRRISETHRPYDALQYLLLFPYGEDGYHFGILQNGSTLKTVSCRAFYTYLLMMCILPATFTGSPRYMHARTQNAMTYVRKYGRPDLFITFTCNPKWYAIVKELMPGQSAYDRPDLIARVYHLKLGKLMDVIKKGQVLGAVCCRMHTIEWQKRGLPHAHILIWLCDKIEATEIDHLISAEIPDLSADPELYEIVITNMIHGPCGSHYTSCHNSDGKCTRQYPRDFVSETITGSDDYPLYRRRSPAEGGFTAVEGSVDEIQDFLAGRVISITEGPWHIFSFPIHERFPATEGYPGVKKDATLGRVFTVPPSRQECFYLRLLLHEVSGPTSYNNLRTVNGVLCDTFRKACLRLGLLEDDSQWDATMAEGALLKMPSALRHLFTTILQMCEPSDSKSL
ncbi:unnamed protein product [Acanthosepion pharaonis]|uniref:Helitron helicase-like domain-containing protein n=1 Tax=Acanthosepion pharaonis TaxID=158019 RepID=A0A812AK93_ACAPH|nr:unnamed protein product [Sepia pharaonis]